MEVEEVANPIAEAHKAALKKQFEKICENVETYETYLYAMVPKTELDLMFIVDCTGSMGSWIEAVKTQIFTIVKGIQNRYKTCCIRLSFVGYRDLKDQKRFEIFPFDTNWKKFHKFVSQVKASGGDDSPEDVYGGFDQALKQQWGSSAKYAVFIADAPGHGLKYHDVDDNYPKGDPSGNDLEPFMKSFAEKKIDLFSGTIGQINIKMMKLLSTEYQKLSHKPIGECALSKDNSRGEFSKFILETSMKTIQSDIDNSGIQQVDFQKFYYNIIQIMQRNTQFSSSNKEFAEKYHRSILAAKAAYEEEHNYVEDRVDLEKLQIFGKINAKCHIFSVKNLNSLGSIVWEEPIEFDSTEEIREINVKVDNSKICSQNFIVEILDQNDKLVGRISRNSRTDSTKDAYIQSHINQLITQQILGQLNVEFKLKVFEIEAANGQKIFITAEQKRLSDEDNNNTQISQGSLKFDSDEIYKQTIAHRSYELTRGQYIVAKCCLCEKDKLAITSPQVYSLNSKCIISQKNQGFSGIFKFFVNHSCGLDCQSLQLTSVEDVNIQVN